MYQIFNEDVTQWVWDGKPFHALLCDPPYHMTTITKRFGKKDAAPAKYGTDGIFQRASKGFMGQEWDGGDVAFRPETWYHLGQFMYDGAFGMAFASARGFHRMAVAIEDAGFIIHPMISWCYSTGFPKATRLDKQIDKMLGKEQEVVGVGKSGKSRQVWEAARHPESFGGDYDITQPASDLAQAWSGHRYGLQALKPAAEPIIVFQKPYVGKPVECMVETGAGALNIEMGRIGINLDHDNVSLKTKRRERNPGVWKDNSGFKNEVHEWASVRPEGRWPANFVLTHHADCKIVGYKDGDNYTINRFDDGMKPFGNGAGHDYSSEKISAGKVAIWECVDGCPAKAMDEQSGNRKSNYCDKPSDCKEDGKWGTLQGHRPPRGYNDNGGASRFFHQSGWQIENADPFLYQAKANNKEREAGLDERCSHPTVKPIALTQYLASLLLPPDIYTPRRIMIPFSGVASEMIGAHFAGWETIVGIEASPDYIEIAEARLKYWCGQPIQLDLL